MPTSIVVKDGNGATQTVATLDALVGSIAPVVSTALEASKVLNASPCSVFGFQVNSTTAVAGRSFMGFAAPVMIPLRPLRKLDFLLPH